MLRILSLWSLSIVVFASSVSPKNINNFVRRNDMTKANQTPDESELEEAFPTTDSADIAENSDSLDSSAYFIDLAQNIANPSREDMDNLSYRDRAQKRSVFRRGAACSAKKSDPTIPYPKSWQRKPRGGAHATQLNDESCASHNHKNLLLTCGGPKYPQGGQINLWNCVLGKIFFFFFFWKSTQSLIDN